ncbi:MAG: adenosylhomocysteinase [Thermoprotei archaeon]
MLRCRVVYKIKDPSLADEGERQIEWARYNMPVLRSLEKEFSKSRPLEGVRIGACLHVTKETGVLMMLLLMGGAEIALAGSNPLSTQDDVAAELVRRGVHVYAWRRETEDEYYWALNKVYEFSPNITMDDGGDLTVLLHKNKASNVWGGTEETTTGVYRLKALEREGLLLYPIIAVNDAKTKYLFDNRYGTGQSALDGIMRATNMLISGKTVVVAGYGWVGRGIAVRARGLGARVIVVEADPIKALEAVMDGYEVMNMNEASIRGDIFITATGNTSVIRAEHMRKMKDGVVLANAGHFNVEVSVRDLELLSKSSYEVRKNVKAYVLQDGKRIYLIAEGRLVNLVAAEGHPSEVMDMSFSLQALSVKYLVENKDRLKKAVYNVPEDIDKLVATLKLQSMGVTIEKLTEEQEKYLKSWSLGT